jgi:hypothetical protein
MDDFLRGRGRHFLARDRMQRGILKARQHFTWFDAHRLGDPLPIGNQPRDHRHPVSVRTREQRGLASVEPLGGGGQFKTQRGIRLDHGEPVTRSQMVEPIAERADRLRHIALDARGIVRR